MIEIYKRVMFDNYANFSGRARRSEFWYTTLINTIFFIISFICLFKFINISDIVSYTIGGIIVLFFFITLIPRLALISRRLHDTGKSGWFYLLTFIPGGNLILLIFFIMDSQPGSNQWGPNPKETDDSINEIGNDLIERY
ncbi:MULTISPECIES: DUF805 domain-containing protein [Empedobacter]|uniref:DUF805 domain-containing protein n=2 Tax=Weeksellaceae TaxID=2762318 RepID=A0A7H9DNX6_9FLAO|nr:MULTISPECIES: DUF805 domain-containing protein [Empedobacter]MDM1137963.1 DUF805 domain-containing protein [Empedobacter sp. R132-2]QLL56794.1 DUF805 domain-containing protein [Empedobacter falsenii]